MHLLRVMRDGAYTGVRQTIWHTGLALGLILLLANFSGYLLPHDQLAYWAGTIAISLATRLVPGQVPLLLEGNASSEAANLLLTFKLHVIICPALLLVLTALHIHGVRRAGGILLPKHQESGPLVQANPELFVREAAWAALVACALLLWSMVMPAPLGPMADPLTTPALLQAPWFSAGYQTLLFRWNLHPASGLAWSQSCSLGRTK